MHIATLHKNAYHLNVIMQKIFINQAMSYKLYPITLAVLLSIDSIWLTVIAKNLYANELAGLITSHVNWIAALLFYVLFSIGIVNFVIQPALNQKSGTKCLQLGLQFGLVAYATYDLTNLATIKDWPLTITIIDLIWGSCVTAITAIISYSIGRKFFVKNTY